MLIGIILVRNEQGRYLEKVLAQMRSICDKLYALDDASTDDTAKICAEYCDVVVIGKEPLWGVNELIRRKQLWHLAELAASDGDYILCLDADETITDIDKLPEIISAIEQARTNGDIFVDGIAFPLYDMWSETHYRDDMLWNAHTRPWVMCARYDAYREYIWKETPLHCNRFPLNACGLAIRSDPLKIQHWGYSREADRESKYKRYMEVDPNGQTGSIDQYRSILDGSPSLKRFGMTDNRYFLVDDPHSSTIDGYQLPETWWSRPYEYIWAKSKIIPGEVVLDAGCGLEHPFKYILANYCAKVYAVDGDERILGSPPHPKVEYLWENICHMESVADCAVDTVYCISVLEHMAIADRELLVDEFYRVLRPGGRLVVTMDILEGSSGSGISCPGEVLSQFYRKFSVAEDVSESICRNVLEATDGTRIFRATLERWE